MSFSRSQVPEFIILSNTIFSQQQSYNENETKPFFLSSQIYEPKTNKK